jgi:hypothetical protein
VARRRLAGGIDLETVEMTTVTGNVVVVVRVQRPSTGEGLSDTEVERVTTTTAGAHIERQLAG